MYLVMYNMIQDYDNLISMIGDFNTVLDPAKDRARDRRDYQDQKCYSIALMR